MTIQTKIKLTEPGPRVFPMIAGIGIAVCGLGILITEFNKREGKPFLEKAGWQRYGISASVLVVYAVLLNFLGFLISTPLAVLALSRIFTQKKYNFIVGIIVAVASTGIIFYIFNGVFHLPLPTGKLF